MTLGKHLGPFAANRKERNLVLVVAPRAPHRQSQRVPMLLERTPIALLQLRYQSAQTFAAALGIAFTTVMLFMQVGFRSGFLDNLVELPERLQGDAFVLNSSMVTILRPPTFSEHRLHQVLGFKEVEQITPVYLAPILMRDPTGKPRFLRKIQVVGFPASGMPLDVKGLRDEDIEKLKRGRVFLIDRKSRPEFRPVIDTVEREGALEIEVRFGAKQSRISIEGLFEMGANTSADSQLLTSDATFLEVLGRKRGQINIGLVKLKPGTDVAAFVQKVQDYLPPDVFIVEKQALLGQERHFYEFGSPIGLIFRFGLGGAILVGIVILYQILFQIISKYLRDYATLKAIGFSHGMLRAIVLREALILAVVGYLPGFGLSLYVYNILSTSTSLKFVMTADVAIVVLLAVSAICLISALIAIRKLREADPADLFG